MTTSESRKVPKNHKSLVKSIYFTDGHRQLKSLMDWIGELMKGQTCR